MQNFYQYYDLAMGCEVEVHSVLLFQFSWEPAYKQINRETPYDVATRSSKCQTSPSPSNMATTRPLKHFVLVWQRPQFFICCRWCSVSHHWTFYTLETETWAEQCDLSGRQATHSNRMCHFSKMSHFVGVSKEHTASQEKHPAVRAASFTLSW